VSLDANSDDEDYFSYDLSEYGDLDIPAMLEVIKSESTSCKKVSIVSHSMGTIATLIGLSKAANAEDYVGQVVLMEPCPNANVKKFIELSPIANWGVSTLLWTLGIESILGPQWPSQRRKLCWFVGWWSDYCDLLYDIDVFSDSNLFGYQEASVKVAQHLM